MNKQEDIIIKKIADEIERREFRREQEIADQKRKQNTLIIDLVLGVITIIAGSGILYLNFMLNVPILALVIIAVFLGVLSGVIILYIFIEAKGLLKS